MRDEVQTSMDGWMDGWMDVGQRAQAKVKTHVSQGQERSARDERARAGA